MQSKESVVESRLLTLQLEPLVHRLSMELHQLGRWSLARARDFRMSIVGVSHSFLSCYFGFGPASRLARLGNLPLGTRQRLYRAGPRGSDPPVGRLAFCFASRCFDDLGDGARAEPPAFEPRPEVQRQSQRVGSAQQVPQRKPRRLPRLFQGHRLMGLSFEDAGHESGQDAAGTRLDEQPGAVTMQRLDLVGEANATREILCQQFAHALDVRGVRFRRDVAVDRELRRPHRRLGQVGAQALRGLFHRGRVERSVHRHAANGDALLQQALDRGVQHVGRAGDDRLLGPVGVGQVGRDLQLLERGARGLLIRRHRGHSSGVPLCHVMQHQPANGGQAQQPRPGKGTRGGEGHRLAIAVPGGERGPQPEALEHLQREQAGHAQRRLRDARIHQRFDLRLLLFLVESRTREDPVGETPRHQVGEHHVRFLEPRRPERHTLREILQHARVLSTLAGEQEADRRRLDRFLVAQIDALAVLQRPAFRQGLERPVEFGFQIFQRGCQNRTTQHRGVLRSPCALFRMYGTGQPIEAQPRETGDRLPQGL